MADSADPDEVKSFARGLSDEFLECRILSHNWQPFQAAWERDADAYLVQYLCERCNSARHMWIDRFGDVVRGGYDYEDGYQHIGMGRITGRGRSALRLESLSRILGSRTPMRRARRIKERDDSGD
jgi:hypothetical protein